MEFSDCAVYSEPSLWAKWHKGSFSHCAPSLSGDICFTTKISTTSNVERVLTQQIHNVAGTSLQRRSDVVTTLLRRCVVCWEPRSS